MPKENGNLRKMYLALNIVKPKPEFGSTNDVNTAGNFLNAIISLSII